MAVERKGSSEAYNRSAGYAYDSLGRMVSCAEGADSESYAYGALGNRTLKTTGEETGYTYNALDRRVKNVRRSAGIIKETDFVADYISGYRNDLMEYESGGAATRNVHGRRYELLSRRNNLDPEGKTYYHADFYGSPLVVADGDLQTQR